MYIYISFFHYKLVAHHIPTYGMPASIYGISPVLETSHTLCTHTHTHVHTQTSMHIRTQRTGMSLNDSTKYVLVCLQVALSAPSIPVYILHTLPE